jgi:hypothetical protein
MSELTQTINIRTTFEMKRRILDNAAKKGMNQSEYILFAVESYLKGISNHISESNLEVDNSQLTQLQEQLAATNNQLRQLKEDVTLEKKSILQEATDLAHKMSSERIQQAQVQAVRVYQEKRINEVDSTNQQIRILQERIFAYETPLLKEVFNYTSQNPQIRDYPDVVYFLLHCYKQQIQQYSQYAIEQ